MNKLLAAGLVLLAVSAATARPLESDRVATARPVEPGEAAAARPIERGPAVGRPLEPGWVAEDALWLVHVDVGAFKNSTIGRHVLEHADQFGLEDLDEFEREVGLDPRTDFVSVTLYGASEDPEADGVIVAVTSARADEALARLKASQEIDSVEAVLDGYTVHILADGGERHYLHVRPADRRDQRIVVLAGSEEVLLDAVRVIDGKAPGLARGKSTVLDGGPGAGSIVFVACGGGDLLAVTCWGWSPPPKSCACPTASRSTSERRKAGPTPKRRCRRAARRTRPTSPTSWKGCSPSAGSSPPSSRRPVRWRASRTPSRSRPATGRSPSASGSTRSSSWGCSGYLMSFSGTIPRSAPAARPRRLGDLEVPELVSRARNGSLPCFAELVRLYEGRLFNFLLRRTRSAADAEDLVQETFVRAWQRIGQYNPRWQFSTWLFTIARRLAIAQIVAHERRRQGEAAPACLAHAASGVRDPAGPLTDREQCRHIWALADRILPETQRTALWLRYAEGLGTKEIARVLGKSRVMVRVTLFRAREALAARRRAEGAPAPAAKTTQPLTGELVC
jgi:RNA polymerase sigma-70 factor (ECF subfamily)